MVKLTVNSAESDSQTIAPVLSSAAPGERRNIHPPTAICSSNSPEPEPVKSKVILCLVSQQLQDKNDDPACKQVLFFFFLYACDYRLSFTF